MTTLYIFCDNQRRELIQNVIANRRVTDSGFDIPMVSCHVNLANNPANQHKFKLGIYVAAVDENSRPMPCLLLPRSSLSATPYRLANSVGLIDSGYRGEVSAVVDIVHANVFIHPNHIEAGKRLFQICSHNFLPWSHVVLVDNVNNLPEALDNRGAGGFGSTN